MPGNDNVTVRIVGDASGVAPAVQQAGGALGGLEPILAELNANMTALAAQMREGFAAGAAGAHQLAAGMEEAKVAAGGLGAGVEGAVLKIHEGAEAVRTFQMRAKEFAEVYVAMFAVEQVAEFVNKMGEAAEKVIHLGQTFGMTAGQVQQLQGVAIATGISFDALAKGLQFLDRNLATAAEGSRQVKQAMDAVGISLNDGRDQMQKLEVVADKFANMADGPKKVALAMQLFGRSGAQLIPILNMGSAGIAQLNQKMDEYGVKNDAAVEKGALLADSVNETKLGLMGLQNTLMEALAPALTEVVTRVNELIEGFIRSYQEGGAAREIMVALSGTINDLLTFFAALGRITNAVAVAFYDMANTIGQNADQTFAHRVPTDINYTKQAFQTLKNLIVFVSDAILIVIEELKLGFDELALRVKSDGQIIIDALTGHWGSIEADWDAGLDAIAAKVQQTTNKVVGLAHEMYAAFKGMQTLSDIPILPPELQGLQTPKPAGNFDYNPTGTPKKEKKPKDDLVQKLDEELEAKKVAFEKEQLAQDTAQEYSLESERDFWAQALERTDLSAKDKLEIEKKWIAASQALQKEEIAKRLEGYKADIDSAGSNWQAKLKILEDERAYVHRMYGDKSKEAAAADADVIKAERSAAEQLRQLWNSYYQEQAQLALMRVADEQAQAELEVELGAKSKGQLLAQEKDFENQRFRIQLQELQREKTLVDPNRDPGAYQKICQQIERLEAQHQQTLTQLDRQAVLQRTAIERNAVNQFASSWASALAKFATLQASVASTIKALWQGVQQAIEGVIEQLLEKFIAAEVTKLIFGKATAQATIAGEAAKAGAGGVASMAAAPFPMDLTAPAFGAAMSTAAMAFSGLNSAEGGWWDVQPGIAQLHAREMVLPAWAAEPLRAMLAGSAPRPANANAPAAANDSGGDTHLHFHGPIVGSRAAMEQWARQNRHMFGAGARAYARGGGSVDPTRPR